MALAIENARLLDQVEQTVVKADRVEVRLQKKGEAIILEIEGHGLGFEPQQEYPGHMGLQSMQERLLKVEGSLAVESNPGDGTRIRACIPVRKEGNA